MQSIRWLTPLFIAAVVAYPGQAANARLYEFSIHGSADATGIGDPGLSQAVRDPSGDIYVLVPLQSVTNIPPFTFPTLVFHGPPSGVVLTSPSSQYDINFGGGLPVCSPAFPQCVSPLGTIYVNYAGLSSDMWGHFEGGTAGQPLTWVSNPDPGAHSSAVLPPLGGFLPFPGTFSMTPVIPEPPIALLFGVGLAAMLLRRRQPDSASIYVNHADKPEQNIDE